MTTEKYTNFHGECLEGVFVDSVLRSYFPDYTYKGILFDIGAFEPIRISNSYHFEKNGWDTYCFEANTDNIPLLKQHRKNVFNYAIYDVDIEEVTFNVVKANGWTAGYSAIELNPIYMSWNPRSIKKITQIKVPQKTLNTVLETELQNIKKIDILDIDVEGGELQVIKGLNLLKYRPTVVLIENVTHDENYRNYIEQFGYKLDKTDVHNDYYIQKGWSPNPINEAGIF